MLTGKALSGVEVFLLAQRAARLFFWNLSLSGRWLFLALNLWRQLAGNFCLHAQSSGARWLPPGKPLDSLNMCLYFMGNSWLIHCSWLLARFAATWRTVLSPRQSSPFALCGDKRVVVGAVLCGLLFCFRLPMHYELHFVISMRRRLVPVTMRKYTSPNRRRSPMV